MGKVKDVMNFFGGEQKSTERKQQKPSIAGSLNFANLARDSNGSGDGRSRNSRSKSKLKK